MSRWRTKPVRYTCYNDCRQSGCPGHELVLEHCISSDTISVIVDGEYWHCYDDGAAIALSKALNLKPGEEPIHNEGSR